MSAFECVRHHLRTNSYRVFKAHLTTEPHAFEDLLRVAGIDVNVLWSPKMGHRP